MSTAAVSRKLGASRSAPVKPEKRNELIEDLRVTVGALFARYLDLFGGAAIPELTIDLRDYLIDATRKSSAGEYFKALIRGLQARIEMLDSDGGCFSAEEVARILGVSKTRALDRYHEGSLIGVRSGKQNAIKFPNWQFDKVGNVRHGVSETISIFRQVPSLTDWTIFTFFLTPRESLENRRPLDLLLAGESERVVNLARADVE
jgi:hypothetical protein